MAKGFRKGQKVRFTWGSYASEGTIVKEWKTLGGKKRYDVRVWNPNFKHYNVYPLSASMMSYTKRRKKRR
jgi:hypothetical protein